MSTAAGQPARQRINLDAPGALAAVEREHPDHFARIQRILSEVPRRPPAGDSVATWMRTEFQATDVQYADFLMVTDPPKKRLEFSLDRTTYVTVITLDVGARPMPLKDAPVR
jgi:hypothetical protein